MVSGSDLLAGRRIRCPECNTMVEARDRATGTVLLNPDERGQTVMLEVVEVTGADATAEPVEISEPVEATETIEVTRPADLAGEFAGCF